MSLRLAWSSHEAAKYAVEHWHYSGVMPKYKTIKVGVWESGRFVGAVVFSRGATPALLKPYSLKITEGCELTRVALDRHKTPTTRVVAVALRMLKAIFPACRLVVSFADPAQGHVGTIYQGGGWVYTGTTSPSHMYRDANGKLWHERNVSERGYKKYGIIKCRVRRPSEMQKLTMPGKHRYLMPLDADMRARIASLAKPYPKRAGSIVADAPANHAGEGGSVPTPALTLQS